MLTNEDPELRGQSWRVKVDAIVHTPPAGETHLHYIIDVDRTTGVPVIHAQG